MILFLSVFKQFLDSNVVPVETRSYVVLLATRINGDRCAHTESNGDQCAHRKLGRQHLEICIWYAVCTAYIHKDM